MAVLKKYNLAGKAVGEISLDDELLKTPSNGQMIKDYLVAIRANARQWSASTQGRAEVNHSGKKPHPQKGTGRARQGYLGAPQYRGGGRVHAPKPKFDQHVRINRKERRAAIAQLIAEKVGANRVHVLQFEALDAPKTKRLADFIAALTLAGKRVLFLGEGCVDADPKGDAVSPREKFENLKKSLRNIPRAGFQLMPNVSGYDIVVNSDIVVLDGAIDQFKVLLGGA